MRSSRPALTPYLSRSWSLGGLFVLVVLAMLLAPIERALAAAADNLGSATVLVLPLSNDPTNTTGATRDAGEVGGGPASSSCNFPAAGNTHSVWYRYTASSNGWLQLDTFGSSYDTVLEVFSGPPVPTFATLTSIACNDDAAGLRQSVLNAPVAAGTDYYIVVRWSVSQPLAPGESVTLTSLPTSYHPDYTRWPGSFQTTQLDLYLYVDSWNPNDPDGAVKESNEANNRAQLAP